MSASRFSWFNATSITLGFVFLYVPIIILIIFSFNASKLVTVWGGFSLRWYESVFNNEAFMSAAAMTLKVGLLSATFATILGTMGALVLMRIGRFPGRLLFSSLIYSPLVMPEIITGLAMLLLFVAISLDRGYWTIVIAHITFTMCYVSVVVSSRLVSFDQSLEEAALDLGCTRFSAFMQVTLPIILPAIVSGWLLAFTLSLDDLVITSFVSGPGSTTLPMKIYSQVRLGLNPEINALSTLLILVVSTAVVIASVLTKRAEVKRQAEERAAFANP